MATVLIALQSREGEGEGWIKEEGADRRWEAGGEVGGEGGEVMERERKAPRRLPATGPQHKAHISDGGTT